MSRKFFKKHWLFLAIVIVVILYLVLSTLPPVVNFVNTAFEVLSPLLLGVLFALILYMPCIKLENKFKKIPLLKNRARGISVLSVYVILITLLVLLFNFIIPIIYDNILELINNIPAIYEYAVDYINNIPEDSILAAIDFDSIMSEINISNATSFLDSDTIFSSIKGVFNFANSIFTIFLGVIISIYILITRANIAKFVKRFTNAVSNKKTEAAVAKYMHKTTSIFSGFVNGQILDAFVMGILATIVLSILNVDYALTLGPLIGLANLIPYFGAIFASAFAILVTIFTGGFLQAVIVFICILAVQQIDANVIYPKIMGDSLKISPLLVILAVSICGGLFGVAGMFLGVPFVALLKLMVIDYIEYREKQKRKPVKN